MFFSNSESFLVQVCTNSFLLVVAMFLLSHVRANSESSPVILTVAVLQAQSQEDQQEWVAAINVRRVLQFVL